MTNSVDDRIREMMQRVVDELPTPPDLPTGPPPTPVPAQRVPNWAVAVGAAIAVFILIGGVAWLFGDGEPDVADEPRITTTTVPAVPSELAPAIAAARTDGVAFDFAEHDLCEWFATDEIRSIVADAYQAEGVAYPIPTTLTAGRRGNSFPQWGCSWAGGGTTDSPNLATFDLTFHAMSEEELGDNEEPIHRPPADWGADDLVRDGVVLLPPLDAPNIYLASRDELLLIGHIPAAPVDAGVAVNSTSKPGFKPKYHHGSKAPSASASRSEYST